MKQVSFNMLFSFLLICSFSACEKEYEPTGRFGFVFKVDGEFFKARKDDWKGSPAIKAFIKKDILGASGTYSIGSSYHSVGFRIINFTGPGTYLLNSDSVNYGRYHGPGFIHTYTNSFYTGELIITHHLPDKGIIAGTFSFTAFDSDTGEAYEITDGKFDIFYTIY